MRGDRLAALQAAAAVGAQPAVGFVPDLGPMGPCPREAAWEVQLARLSAYKAEHGDCSVPARWADDSWLGRWVNDQRLRKKKLDRGDASHGMTVELAARLTALGIDWNPDKK